MSESGMSESGMRESGMRESGTHGSGVHGSVGSSGVQSAATGNERLVPLLTDDPASVRVESSETVFTGKIWDVRRDRFDLGGSSLVREYLDHPGAVAVLALDDADRVVLIKQYRHPLRMHSWEIPAGLLDVQGEAPLSGAQRELAEEADLVADQWSVLAEFVTTPGASNEAIRIYLARGLRATFQKFVREGEESEIELRRVPLDDVIGAVLARRIQNPSLVVAVLAANAARANGWKRLGEADEPWPRHPQSPHNPSARRAD